MEDTNFKRFLSSISFIGFASVVTCIISQLLFGNKFIPFVYVFTGIVCLFLFIRLYKFAVIRMANLPENMLVLRLFWISFVIRVIVVIGLYFVFISITGTPQHPDAADAIMYHKRGIDVSIQIHRGFFDPLKFAAGHLRYDDIGFFAFIGILYSIFGPYYLVLRIFQCLLGAWTVVFAYKILKIVWDYEIAIRGALLLSFFPSMLYYTAIHNKESFMIFLVFMYLYGSISILNLKRIRIKFIALVFVSISSMIFTRMPLAVVMVITTSSAFLFQKAKLGKLKSAIIIILIMTSVIIMMSEVGVYDEGKDYVQRFVSLSNKGELIVKGRSVDSYVVRGQKFARYASTPLMVALSVITPFPSLVKTNIRFFKQTEHWYHVAGLFLWGALSYFSIIGLIYSIRYKFNESYVLWTLTLGYMVMISLAMYGFSIRFNIIKIPLLLMFTVPGVKYAKFSIIRKWKLYIVVICGIIIAWNYVKLAGRGLI